MEHSQSRVVGGVLARCQLSTFQPAVALSFGDNLSGGMKVSLPLRVFRSSERHHFWLGGRWTCGMGLRVTQLEGLRDRTLEKED